MNSKLNIALFVASAAFVSIAAADESGAPVFKFGGFGTIGASHSSQSLGDYVLDGTVPKGAGLSSNWAMGNDSRLGAQVSADFSPKLSAIVQVIAEYQYDNTYRPTVEWANAKYAVTPNFYVRAGRIALPTFIYSDTRKVGYSYPWIHPPVDLYRQLAITNSDGVDAMYRFDMGEVVNSTKVLYGSSKSDRPTSVSTSNDIWGIFDTIEYGAAMLRVAYQQRNSSSQNRLTGVVGPSVPNTDMSVGASYDPGGWFMVGEWLQRESTNRSNSVYLSAGYRVNKFTPFLTYSIDSQGIFLAGFPPPTAAAIRSAKRSQSTVSLGARWDFMKNTDLKLQYDLVTLGNDSNGYLANVPVGTTLYGARFHVISAAVDFVF